MNSPHRWKRLSSMVVAATLIASATTYAQEHREGVRPRPTEFLRLKAQVEILEARIEQLEAQLTGGRRPARPRGARVVPLRREPSGESGAVYEHADRTKRIATARITFTSEDGASKFETISGDGIQQVHDIWPRWGVTPVAEHLCIRGMLESVCIELNMRFAKLDIVIEFGMFCNYNITQHNGIRNKIQKGLRGFPTNFERFSKIF